MLNSTKDQETKQKIEGTHIIRKYCMYTEAINQEVHKIVIHNGKC